MLIFKREMKFFHASSHRLNVQHEDLKLLYNIFYRSKIPFAFISDSDICDMA